MKLSYEEIRKIHRKETESNLLTEIDENFFDELKEYINEEKKDATKDSFDDSKIRKLSNVKRMIEDIFYLRQRKIINRVILDTKKETNIKQNLTLYEQQMYYKLKKILDEYLDEYKQLFKKENKKEELIKIKLLSDIPEFIGVDMKEYGPFQKGDIIKISSSIAKLLINKEKAELIN